MDTLVIVRKIREAESLADTGRHDDARAVLEPLLESASLTEGHKDLLAKKLTLFERQRQRLIRRAAGDPSTAATVVRDADDVNASDRPTDLQVEHHSSGVATEVVPKEKQSSSRSLTRSTSNDFHADSAPPVQAMGEETPAPGLPAAADTDVPAPGPSGRYGGQSDLSGRADAYFAALDGHSDIELEQLVEQLPPDDPRRSLALEVIKLRREVERIKSGSSEAAKPDTRRHRNAEHPQSGSFRIPASQLNTIVRTAAGTDGVDVHMPGRDDDDAALKVLRRDSVSSRTSALKAEARPSVVREAVESAGHERVNRARPFLFGVALIFGALLIVWTVILVIKTVSTSAE